MKSNFSLVLLFFGVVFFAKYTEALPWPIPPQDSAHTIDKIYGDWNVSVYHDAVDMPAPHGTPVLAVENGIITSTGTVDTFNLCWVAVKQSVTDTTAWIYLHTVRKDSSIAKDSLVNAGDTIGHVCDFMGPGDPHDHLHFQLSDTATLIRLDLGYTNPQDSLDPAIPSQIPKIYSGRDLVHHPYQIYYVAEHVEDTINSYERTYLRDSLDIIVRAGVNALGDTCSGVHALGYGIQPMTVGGDVPFREMFEMHGGMELSRDSIKHCLTFAGPPDGPSSMSSHWKKYYVVTNCGDSTPQSGYGISNIKENCWPTKINIAGTADADSIEDARFPDGYYVTTIKVWAHSGDSAVALDTVLVDNFNPKVVTTYPNNWYYWIAEDEREVWCAFSEAMDTTTLITANITIRSLVDTSHYYPITNITYIDSTFELILEVDSFIFHDEVEVQLSDSIMDLAGKSLEQGGGKEKSVAYSWKFTVGVIKLTDNEIDDIRPDIYGDRIAWVEVLSLSPLTSNTKLHDLTLHNTLTLNTTTGFHNWPIVWKGQVAWRQEFGSEPFCRDRIYHYDGDSTRLIVSEDLCRNQFDFDSCGVVMYSSVYSDGSAPDTIWVQYYEIGSGLLLLDEYTVRDDLSRDVNIDGNQIAWEHAEDASGFDGGERLVSDGSFVTRYQRGFSSGKGSEGTRIPLDIRAGSRRTYVKDIYLRSYSGVSNLTSFMDTTINGMPSLSHGQVAWVSYIFAGSTSPISVWVYDGANSRQLSESLSSSYMIYWPVIENGDVVWCDYDWNTGQQRLHYYDGWQDNILASGSALYDFIFWDWHVENAQAVWLELTPSYNYSPTYYDGEQPITLVDRELSSYRIGVNDGLVVYDAWDGNDYEIYLYIGDTLFTPPAVAQNLCNEILETDYDNENDTAVQLTTELDSKQASKKGQEGKADERNDPQIRLIWSPNSEPDLNGYNIYRSETAYTYGTIPYATVSDIDTIYLDTLPVTGPNYYVVTAFDDLNNESGFSNQTLADLTPDTIPPSPPANFAAVCDSPYQVANLSWDASPEPDLGMYRIYRADSSGGYSAPLDSVADSVTTLADSTIVQGMTYYYVATAVDTNNNESGYSNEDTVVVPDITPPSAPANFVANYDSIEQVVDLSWSASPEPDLGLYRIYRSETSGSYEAPLDSVQEPTTTFVDSTILFDTTYYYVVTAVDTNNNESGYSNEETVVVPDTTPPSSPTNLVAAYDSISQIVSLNWSAPSEPDIELYRVYRSMTSGSYGTPLDSVSADDTTFMDSTITLGETFYYVVTAVDSSNNESNYSNEDTVDVPVRFMSYSSLASAYNNGFRMVRNAATDELFLSYAMSDSSALCTSTDDDGTTWSRSAFVGPGCFPSMALDSDTNVHCVFRGMVDMDFLGRSGGSRMSRYDVQDMQNNGFLAERASAGKTRKKSSELSTTGGLLGHRTLYYTVVYAWYSNNTWQNTSLYETQDSILSVSFAIDPCDTGWVVLNTYDNQGNNNLKVGQFYTQTTPDSLENVTNLDTYTSMGIGALAAMPSDTSIWVVYERNGYIYCKFRLNNGNWYTNAVQSEGIHPSLSVSQAGDLVHLIWEKYYAATNNREIQTATTEGFSKVQTIASVKNEGCYPHIEKGSIAVWSDQTNPSQLDVYMSRRTESGTWTTPVNISQSSASSKYPQVALHQTVTQAKFIYTWTEGSQLPYEVKVKPDSLSSYFVPLYAFNLGEEEACVFSVKRDGCVKYGIGYEKTADYGNDYLHYRITGLNPEKIYKLRLVSYQGETDAVWQQTIEIDNNLVEFVDLDCDDVVATDLMLSQENYADGRVDLKIRNVIGPNAVLSAMSVWEYDKDDRITISSGPQSSDSELLGSISFSGIYPNPGDDRTKIKLNAPYPCNVSIRLYDVTGRMVDEIFIGPITGFHEIPVVSKETASGVYFVRVIAEGETITEKVILLR